MGSNQAAMRRVSRRINGWRVAEHVMIDPVLIVRGSI